MSLSNSTLRGPGPACAASVAAGRRPAPLFIFPLHVPVGTTYKGHVAMAASGATAIILRRRHSCRVRYVSRTWQPAPASSFDRRAWCAAGHEDRSA